MQGDRKLRKSAVGLAGRQRMLCIDKPALSTHSLLSASSFKERRGG